MSPITHLTGAARARVGGASVVVPPSADIVPFLVTRWDGSSGTVRVFGAIPLKPGRVYDTDLTQIRVFDQNGTEKQIAVRAATSKFPDASTYNGRSLRCVHVQFLHSVNNAQELDFTVHINNGTRATSDIAWSEPIYSSADKTVAAMTNKATLICEDSQYWCDTFAALTPLLPEASTPSSTAKTWYGTTGATRDSMRWWAEAVAEDGFDSATYEHNHGYYCAAVRASTRAARLFWYKRFWNVLIAQCVDRTSTLVASWFAEGNAYSKVTAWDSSLPTDGGFGLPSEWNTGIYVGLSVGYLATGWSQPKRILNYQASGAAREAVASNAADLRDNLFTSIYLMRFNMGRVMPILAAYVIEATDQINGGYGNGRNNGTQGFGTIMPWVLNAFEHYQWSSVPSYLQGIVGQRSTSTDEGTLTAPVVINYQCRIVAAALIFCWHNVVQDSRIPTWLATLGAYLNSQIVTNGAHRALVYEDQTPPVSVTSFEQWFYGPMLTELYGWLYARTGTAAWKTEGDAFASDAATRQPAGLGGNAQGQLVKFQGEFFPGANQSYLYYVNGGTTSPVTGAHTTQAPIDLPTRVF